jgi:hypothetical protein
VILNNYSLSAWRLYHLLQTIKQEKKLNHYVSLFKKFLKEYIFIENSLLKDVTFLEIFEKIIETEVLWSKRHFWQISFIDTRNARNLLIWDFKNKNCLIYKLMMIWEV